MPGRRFQRATRQRSRPAFAEDAQWIAPEGNATAVAIDGPSHMIGRDAIARFIAEDFGRLFVADVDIAFRSMFGDGDRVAVEERMRATLVNGRSYDNEYCFIFRLRDGLIAEVREYTDTARGFQQVFGKGEPGALEL